jgi:hypothetical protein
LEHLQRHERTRTYYVRLRLTEPEISNACIRHSREAFRLRSV